MSSFKEDISFRKVYVNYYDIPKKCETISIRVLNKSLCSSSRISAKGSRCDGY